MVLQSIQDWISFAVVEIKIGFVVLFLFLFFDLPKMFTTTLNALCSFYLNKAKHLEWVGTEGQNVQYFKFYFTSEEPEAPIMAPF